jgi:hypothetical protein
MQYTGTMLNWSLALGAFTMGGVLWAAVVPAIAVIRLAMDVQRLRRANAELLRQVGRRAHFFDTGFERLGLRGFDVDDVEVEAGAGQGQGQGQGQGRRGSRPKRTDS